MIDLRWLADRVLLHQFVLCARVWRFFKRQAFVVDDFDALRDSVPVWRFRDVIYALFNPLIVNTKLDLVFADPALGRSARSLARADANVDQVSRWSDELLVCESLVLHSLDCAAVTWLP